MTDHQDTLERLFHEARALPTPAERDAFLRRACGSNAAQRARVEALLRGADHADSLFCEADAQQNPPRRSPSLSRGQVGGQTATTVDPDDRPTEQAGTVIGRYKLLEQIGEGGFGMVFMAEQQEPVRRKVALKIIKLGMDTKQVIARFEAERQALALMDHPNIAKVLDAGATETGRPYFVMELVRGDPITNYADNQNLSTEDRLKLFTDVCHAVQHAHQKGVIHRDIKPSNILVTVADGRPIPKVIDFGIAKATNARLTEKTLFTEHRALIGTPEYMSPEQAEMSSADIDTRSDIYSLGVLLYELLTGTTPFERKELMKAGYAEMQRIIRDVEPPKPSTRLALLATANQTPPREWGTNQNPPRRFPSLSRGQVGGRDVSALSSAAPRSLAPSPPSLAESPDFVGGSSDPGYLPGVAERRRTDPKTLVRQLRGDLDWIVMKCLEKDRARRYETTAELAADIRRHLGDLPVNAGPPSRISRFRKFARRNRVILLAATAVGLTLAVGMGLTLHQSSAARQARDDAVSQRDLAQASARKAEREAAKSAAVSRFLQNMFASLDPGKQLGHGVTVREVLDRAVMEVDQRAAGSEPEVDALVRASIGSAYLELGHLESAEPQLRSALECLLGSTGDAQASTAWVLDNLARTLQAKGDYSAAEPLFRQSLEMRRSVLGNTHPDFATGLNNLAMLLRDQGKLTEAEPLAREALDLRRNYQGDDSKDLAISLTSLARLREGFGDFKGAESLDREALELSEAQYGSEHPLVATCLDNLGRSLQKQGNYTGAEPLFRRSLDLKRRMLGDNHIEIVWSLNSLAALLGMRKQYAEAKSLSSQALALAQASLGTEHPTVASAQNTLALMCYETGDMDGAEPLFRRALEIRRKIFGPENPEVATSLNNLALVAIAAKNFAEAEVLLQESLDLRSKLYGDEHPSIAPCLFNLARSLEAQERFSEAEPLYRRALALDRKVLGSDHPRVAASLVGLGQLLQESDRGSEAEDLLREALAIRRKRLPDRNPDTASALGALGWVLTDLGMPASAEAMLRECLEIRLAAFPERHALSAQARSLLGHCLCALRCYDEAEPLLIRGYEDLIIAPQATAGRKREALMRIIRLYEWWEKPERAAEYRAMLTPPELPTSQQDISSNGAGTPHLHQGDPT